MHISPKGKQSQSKQSYQTLYIFQFLSFFQLCGQNVYFTEEQQIIVKSQLLNAILFFLILSFFQLCDQNVYFIKGENSQSYQSHRTFYCDLYSIAFELCVRMHISPKSKKSQYNSELPNAIFKLTFYLFRSLWLQCVLHHMATIIVKTELSNVICFFFLLSFLFLALWLKCVFHRRAKMYSQIRVIERYLEFYILPLSRFVVIIRIQQQSKQSYRMFYFPYILSFFQLCGQNAYYIKEGKPQSNQSNRTLYFFYILPLFQLSGLNASFST